MLRVLLESSARPRRHAGWTAASAAAHATLIAAGVALTLSSGLPEKVETIIDVIPLTAPPASRAPSEVQPSEPVRGAIREAEIVVPTIPTISTISPAIPPASSVPVLADVPGGAGLPDVISRRAIDRTTIFEGDKVDRQVTARRDNARPDYPHALRSAMVEGSVLLQFVVDTAGRVEPQSVSVLQATHPLFAESARRWLARTRYVPAEIRGQRVRQLVQQEVAFTLDR